MAGPGFPNGDGARLGSELMDVDAAVASFDESMLGAGESVFVGPSPKRPALPPPKAASPSALYQRLQGELEFPEGPALLSAMEKWNEDLFSCFPSHSDLYADEALLSTSVDEVVDAALAAQRAPLRYTPEVNLNAHGREPLPEPPVLEDDLEDYVSAVQRFFLAELRAREEHYARLLRGYCLALLQYLQNSARRQLRGAADADAARQRFRQVVRDRYYREAATLARLLHLHLYLSVTREVSWRLHASQVVRQGVFVSLHYSWPQRRQFECMFHPVLFNHGVALLEGRPLEFLDLQRANHRRRELGLPLVRAGLVEEDGQPLEAEPGFSGRLPRAVGFLTHQIRAKMEAYSERHPAAPACPLGEHSYSKRPGDRVSYGTTAEAMMDPPSPSAVLPGDPVPAAAVSVRRRPSTLHLPADVTLQSIEAGGYAPGAHDLNPDTTPGDELNKFFDI
ncbi:transactivating tegument protein VP16 [Equid herpesvirus 6]|uniref:Tegument protein VP16 homolog n=1 Tax=Equid herpesvirus 6 TaxID=173566 RepID=A0A7S9VM02_9ALPH|nr:transactivating tegument protein VP16 [Equid herpesvirus 6]QPI70122.1 transactivating tegument protein VP16 [Equid herpesvirus 6]